VQTRKLICQIYFTACNFSRLCYPISMSTKTFRLRRPVLNKVFAAVDQATAYAPPGSTLTDWREIAGRFGEKKTGDTLRRAIETLSVKYREVLSCKTSRTQHSGNAWVLNITVGAVRYRLLRARCACAMASGASLAETQSENSDLANSYAHDIPCKIQSGRRINFSRVKTGCAYSAHEAVFPSEIEPTSYRSITKIAPDGRRIVRSAFVKVNCPGIFRRFHRAFLNKCHASSLLLGALTISPRSSHTERQREMIL